MAVYKEFYFALTDIKLCSRRIWSDSADFGVPIKKGDRMWSSVIPQIMRYFNPKEDKREVETYSTGTTVSVYINVLNEMDGSYAEEKWKMTYTAVRGNKDFDGILSVEMIERKGSFCRRRQDWDI